MITKKIELKYCIWILFENLFFVLKWWTQRYSVNDFKKIASFIVKFLKH